MVNMISKLFSLMSFVCVWNYVLISGFTIRNSSTGDVKGNDKNYVKIDLPGLGKIVGGIGSTAWSGQKMYQFLGIPFAESPSGELRFKRPYPRSKWDGVFDATKLGKACPVKGDLPVAADDDIEDCLNLNIYTKTFIGKLPVMVFIYGGGFYTGSNQRYTGHYLLEKDIVLVVPQYRLGALGLLSTGTPDIPGNMAIMDIIFALKWVQEHISNFGGDPGRVTIFGQSAGAALCNALMLSPAVPKGLFRQAILQSGSSLGAWATKPYTPELAKNVCEKGKCPNCKDIQAINRCFMEMDVVKFMDISTGENLRTTDVYSFIVDDYYDILPEMPYKLASKSAKYPLITGVTKQEGSYMLAAFYDDMKKKVGNFSKIDPREFIEESIRQADKEDSDGSILNMAMKLFFKSEDIEKRDYKKMIPGLIDLASTLSIKSPVLTYAMLNAKNNPYPTYLYTFDYQGEHTFYGYGLDTEHYPFNGGVHHSDDYIYLFPFFSPLNKKDTEIAKEMVTLWTSFATKGIPDDGKQSTWKPTQGTGPYLHINEVNSIGTDFLDELLVTVNDKTGSIIRADKEF